MFSQASVDFEQLHNTPSTSIISFSTKYPPLYCFLVQLHWRKAKESSFCDLYIGLFLEWRIWHQTANSAFQLIFYISLLMIIFSLCVYWSFSVLWNLLAFVLQKGYIKLSLISVRYVLSLCIGWNSYWLPTAG